MAYISDGAEEGKLCAIVNIIDQNRVSVIKISDLNSFVYC